MPNLQGLEKIRADELPVNPRSDALARREEEALFERDDRERRHIHRAFLVTVWVAVSLTGIMSLTLVWHWVAPESWRWLNDAQTDKLKLALSSALGGGVLTKAVEYKIKK